MKFNENLPQEKPGTRRACYCSWSKIRPRILLRKPSEVFDQSYSNYTSSKVLNWAEANTDDPLMLFPEVQETFRDYSAIYIEIAAKGPGTHARLNFYLAESTNTFSEEKKLSLMIRADGVTHPYLFDIPSNLEGVRRDTLRYIRLDPLDCLGSFSIQSLQLLPAKIAPKFDRQRCLVIVGGQNSDELEAQKKSSWIENASEKPHYIENVIPFDDVDVTSVYIEMATKTASGRGTALLAFKDASANFSNSKTLSVPLVADGSLRTYKVQTSSIPLSGKMMPIRYLQITPLHEAGEFCIQQIRLHPEMFQGDRSEADLRPILYIHIPKAAGNTVNQFLTKYLPRSTILECRRPGVDLADYEPLDKYTVVTGHIGHKAVELFESIRPRVLTILRHPLDQMTSFYYYLQAQPLPASNYPGFERIIDLVHSEPLEAFAVSAHPDVRIISDNYQTWAIGAGEIRWGGFQFVTRTREMLEQAKKNLDSYDAVGIQEDLLNSILLLCYKLNLPLVAMPIPKVNITEQRRTVENLCPEEKASILKRNELDLELYEYGRDLFRRRLAEMITDVGEDQYLRWLKILQNENSR